jgi:membrane protein insertase Oxa1/YidC/SpoIIIJ
MKPGASGLKAFVSWAKTYWVWAIIILLVVIPVVLLPLLLKGTAAIAKIPVIGPLIAKLPAIGGGTTA